MGSLLTRARAAAKALASAPGRASELQHAPQAFALVQQVECYFFAYSADAAFFHCMLGDASIEGSSGILNEGGQVVLS